mmetsp:Transcript_12169/g.32312  ORF Transcript_12169/g.32312 Transcript_12169/m.32312 type:complete len:261 (+) Transcript_12169:91-873(+)
MSKRCHEHAGNGWRIARANAAAGRELRAINFRSGRLSARAKAAARLTYGTLKPLHKLAFVPLREADEARRLAVHASAVLLAVRELPLVRTAIGPRDLAPAVLQAVPKGADVLGPPRPGDAAAGPDAILHPLPIVHASVGGYELAVAMHLVVHPFALVDAPEADPAPAVPLAARAQLPLVHRAVLQRLPRRLARGPFRGSAGRLLSCDGEAERVLRHRLVQRRIWHWLLVARLPHAPVRHHGARLTPELRGGARLVVALGA